MIGLPGFWRRILWIYRSAAGGWYVLVFMHGFHIQGSRVERDRYRSWR